MSFAIRPGFPRGRNGNPTANSPYPQCVAHPLSPGLFEDLSGNRIVHNTIGTNNTGGDPDAGDTSTTGVLVYSGTVPVTVTISHNRIRNDQYGIWLGVGGHVTATLGNNVFQNVATDVFTSP
ncbi:MAG: hypothetical protein E6G12_11920 [Actinobacteria bacterium]|nr:MAG: hypothetical protein E6G12_11920 [Actinomycetota bacterium]